MSVGGWHVDLDVGNLLISNIWDLNSSNQSHQDEQWLKSLAQKGTQLLINKIWELPSEYQEDVAVAKLPEPKTRIPREKHIPKPKPPTRWEQYAKSKGIQRRKKDKLVFDEATKEWKPTWGYHSIKSDKSKWLVEIPDHKDPNADYFAQDKEEKSQRIAKNEYQRLRNIAEASKKKVRNLESVDRASKEEIARSAATAKTSTASLGKFMSKLPKEKPPKNMGKKRKFESNFAADLKTEKDKNLKILEEINKKKPKLDIEEAVQLKIMKSGKNNSGENEGSKKKKNNKKGKNNKNKKGSKNFDSLRKKGKSGFKKRK